MFSKLWITFLLFLVSINESGQESSSSANASRRLRLVDETGALFVGKEYGPESSRLVLLPDGRLASVAHAVYTDEPFHPLSSQLLRDRLLAAEYKGFEVEQTEHYLVFYQCSAEFARNSAKLLESLYAKLFENAEFPLIAVIFRSEEDFWRHREIDPEVQAYYEIMSNRIFLFELSEQMREDPQFAAMRKPQTVTHEGTHQILQNIGIQPRLAAWPAWLTEGLAELAAASDRRNGEWVQFSQVNPLHIATLEDLKDSQALQGSNNLTTQVRLGPPKTETSLVEYLSARKQLGPTDYSLSWALTHYLANKQTPRFLDYLKEMGQLQPGVDRSVEENQIVFTRHFGEKPRTLDVAIEKHLTKLRSQANLVYYGVVFEQPLPGNRLRRGTMVSRSPQVIREWVTDKMPDPQGGSYRWHASEFRTRQEAILATESWIANQ